MSIVPLALEEIPGLSLVVIKKSSALQGYPYAQVPIRLRTTNSKVLNKGCYTE